MDYKAFAIENARVEFGQTFRSPHRCFRVIAGLAPEGQSRTMCNRVLVNEHVTDDPQEVTCGVCKTGMDIAASGTPVRS